MTLNWLDIIAFFTLFQLLFLTVVIFNYRKGKRFRNYLLSGFMASNAILIAQFLLVRFHLISPNRCLVLYSLGSKSYMLLMPFLYLYIRSLCYSDFRLKKVHLWHFVPFLVFALFSLSVNLLVRHASRFGIPASLLHGIGNFEYWSHRTAMHIQIVSYLAASAILLATYRKRLKDLYSSIEKIDLFWCNLLLIGFSTMWLMDFSNWILGVLHMASGPAVRLLFPVSLLINLVFTLAVAYKSLVQSEGFSGIQSPPKYAASRLKPADIEIILRRLTACMNSRKPYLTPSLSIEDLAKDIHIPTKHLSQALHVGLNKPFYDFINFHRIEDAKERIREGRCRNQTLLALAYDVGFNSKSVFNAAFKKHAGMPPKAYKCLHSA